MRINWYFTMRKTISFSRTSIGTSSTWSSSSTPSSVIRTLRLCDCYLSTTNFPLIASMYHAWTTFSSLFSISTLNLFANFIICWKVETIVLISLNQGCLRMALEIDSKSTSIIVEYTVTPLVDKGIVTFSTMAFGSLLYLTRFKLTFSIFASSNFIFLKVDKNITSTELPM